jgi:hypothetical protein
MINQLIELVKSLPDPVLEYGSREDDQSKIVNISPNHNDVTVSTKDRKLSIWKNAPKELIDLCKSIGGKGPSGIWIYDPGDYQGWHTNSDVLGQRLYVSWASEDKKSGMKFFINDIVVDSPDNKGWNIRLFNPPVWHMVYSDCTRASIGFIFDPDISEEILQPVCLK